MFLTEKKVVKINENTLKRKLKADKCHDDENMDYQKVLQSLESGCVYLDTSADENLQTEVIGRKRMRLHQLSWEEKLQRKKMRNRIAAQTSRDRKKAKMDQLEESVKELQQQNIELVSQVSKLAKQNESLLDANKELQKLLSVRSLTCTCQKSTEKSNEIMESSKISLSQNQICVRDDLPFDRPAEGTKASLGTKPDSDFMESLEDFNSLPAFPEMLADVEGQEFFNDLERLAANLLQEVEQHDTRRVTKNLEDENSGNCEEQCKFPNEVVGQASEIMETCGNGGSDFVNDSKHQDHTSHISTNDKIVNISLEHSYAQYNMDFKMEEFLEMKPKEHNIPSIQITEIPSEVDPVPLNETISAEVLPKMSTLDISSFPESGLSDTSSDNGYESLDSPYSSDISNNDFDFWNDSFSELFPELL